MSSVTRDDKIKRENPACARTLLPLADFSNFPAKNRKRSLERASRQRAESGSAKHVEVLFKRKYFSMSPEDGEVSFTDDTSPGFRIDALRGEREKEKRRRREREREK